MTMHVLRVAAITGALLLITLLPFAPGGYDSLASPLSMMARVFGFVGLILVAAGAVWAASWRWHAADTQYPFAAAAVGAWTIVAVMLSLSAFALVGPSLAAATATVALVSVFHAFRRIAVFRTVPSRHMHSIPLYLTAVPLAVLGLQQLLIGPAVEFSRARAIRNAAPMIADIEQHRAQRGRYPASLLSVWRDYSTGVIGVERYHYEPSVKISSTVPQTVRHPLCKLRCWRVACMVTSI